MNKGLEELVLKHTPTVDLKRLARKGGMSTLREDALRKVYAGITSLKEATAITQEDEPLEVKIDPAKSPDYWKGGALFAE